MKKKYLFFLIPILVIGILITLIFTMKLNQNELNESGNVTQSTTKSEKSINAENEATIKQTEVQKQQIEELKSEILFQNVKWGTSFPEINNKFSNWKLLNLHGEGYQTYSTDDILLGSYKGLRFDYSGINVISSALKQQEIAGYTTSEINLYFAFLPVDGCLTYSESDTSLLGITAVKGGKKSNVPANTICILAKPNKNIKSVTNKEAITGGEERESNSDFYDRIASEYENSMTFLGNDSDYVRWAKEAGAGDCIVVSADEGPGTVKLVLVDRNGQPANKELTEAVYNYIVSPNNRESRLLPTACAKLNCVSAVTIKINYTYTGLVLNDNADINKIKNDFRTALLKTYDKAKSQNVLRYNDIRPLISAIDGVKDFDTFTINDKTENIQLAQEEYPTTGTLNFLLAE